LVVFVLVAAMSLGQAVAATQVPRTAIGSSTPARGGLTYSDAAFETSDGVRLSGWYIPSTNGAAVVVLHGAGSTRSDALDQAVVLARHGYGVLVFDARGHGRSAGRAMDFGWYGDEDVSAAVSYLQSRPDVHAGIGALGLSMGGEEALGAAAGDPRIRAVVAEGATNRAPADREWLSDEYGWRGALQEGIDWLTYGVADLLTPAHKPATLRNAAAAVAPRPVLLIAAGAVPDEENADRYIQSGSPRSVQLWVVPDAGHTQGLRVEPGQWEQRVIAFFDSGLLG
jgi:pimeloyl-ACP methyl ester carboxylesterase